MKRRLYFLLPDAEHTAGVIDELEALGIEAQRLHAVAGRDVDTAGLAVDARNQRRDSAALIEKWLWDGNLVLFFAALVALAVMLLLQVQWSWLLLPAGIMLASFLGGMEFASRVPDVHLDEFRDALRHREVLLMVDVPAAQVAEVEARVHRRHPEAVAGGVGWSSELLHV